MDELNFTRSVLNGMSRASRPAVAQTKDAYQSGFRRLCSSRRVRRQSFLIMNVFFRVIPTCRRWRRAAGGVAQGWEGLGYYSRARSLQKAAKLIVSQHGGELPADLEKLRALPGIGDYTSGAIASIAFGIPAAAVDGNVERVVCRYFALSEEMGSPKSRRMIHDLTQALVPPDRPGAFANAMMEMGAMMCTPKSPACLLCPVRETVKAMRGALWRTAGQAQEKSAARRNALRHAGVLRKPGADCSAGRALLGGLSVFPDAAGNCRPRRCARR